LSSEIRHLLVVDANVPIDYAKSGGQKE
jgi:hypothetical protein